MEKNTASASPQRQVLKVCGAKPLLPAEKVKTMERLFGVTMGDSSGVGPEILLKAFAEGKMHAPIVAFGDAAARSAPATCGQSRLRETASWPGSAR
jgi:hypothetical protein